MKIAIYPGSFDPITNGHIDILNRASTVFDKIYVTVLTNPKKECFFTKEERVEIIKETVKDFDNIEVTFYDGLLVDYAEKVNATTIIRGLRAVSDFEYEFQLALTNRELNDHVDTVFFMTSKDYSYLSSGLVKQLSNFNGNISNLVPQIVQDKLKEKREK